MQLKTYLENLLGFLLLMESPSLSDSALLLVTFERSHGHSLPVVFLMVVRLVAHGDLLFSEMPKPFAVDLDAARDRRSWRLLLKDTAHVVKQSSDGQHDRGWLQIVPAVQEELCVLVSLTS